MSTITPDSELQKSVRVILENSVVRTRTSRRRRRVLLFGIPTLAVSMFGAGAAVASIQQIPGGDSVVSLDDAMTVGSNGSETVTLHSAPADTNSLEYRITCITSGSVRLQDGSSMQCADGASSFGNMPWSSGKRQFEVRATGGTQWQLTYFYSRRKTTDFGTKASGQTFGTGAGAKTPDLIAALATNGKTGYIMASDLDADICLNSPPSKRAACSEQENPESIPVYESDGKTVIGQYQPFR